MKDNFIEDLEKTKAGIIEIYGNDEDIHCNNCFSENDVKLYFGHYEKKKLIRIENLIAMNIDKAESKKGMKKGEKICDCIVFHYKGDYFVFLSELKSKHYDFDEVLEQLNSGAKKAVHILKKAKIHDKIKNLYAILIAKTKDRNEKNKFKKHIRQQHWIEGKKIHYLFEKSPVYLTKIIESIS